MIQKVIESFTQKLCNPELFCWIERYGGLATTVKQPSDGTNQKCSYPVSCSVKNKECWENQLYLNLVPDDKYKSIVYFEEVGASQIVDVKKGACVFKQKVRLVFWVNMLQLGYDQCSIIHMLLPQLVKCFHCKNWVQQVQGIGQIYTEVSNILGSTETILRVFNKYNYGDQYCLYLYPYEVGAIDITVQYMVDANCFDPVDVIECKEPIVCQNFAQ